MNRVTLREVLADYFSLDELQTLCFDLNIDFENLRGDSKQAKAREIVAYCERNSQSYELTVAIHRLRPKLSLPEESKTDVVSQREAATGSTDEETVAEPAVPRPVNLSFEAFGIGEWPAGWFNSFRFVTGVSISYEIRVVPRDDGNGMCVLFRNRFATDTEFGSLMQRCPARHLAGKAIRLEAEIETWQVEQRAGMWLRADGDILPDLVFDNMSRRPIRGSTPWTRYSIDAHLPQETTWLNYGILLVGRGTMWADNFRVMIWTSSGKWVDV